MKIAVGGIGHETNTFSTLRTDLDDFGVRRGEEIVQGELWESYRNEGVEWVGTLTAGASPHGLVRRDAYLQLKSELLDRIDAALPFDGMYLSLHGAMEVEEIGDGESDLLAAIRDRIGPDVLLAASFDLHGNIAPDVVEALNILSALRTAPHRDGGPTRARTVAHLVRCVREGLRPVAALVKPPLLLPGEFAITEVEPARSLYARLHEIERTSGILDASLFIGCAWTDAPHTSTSAVVVAEEDRELAHREAARLAGAVWEAREAFGPDVETATVEDAINEAIADPDGGVFLSDSGDNVTAGGAGDVPLFVERLLAADAPDAVVAGLADPAAVAACAEAGTDAIVSLSIGGKLDTVHAQPLAVTGVVLRLDPPERPTLAVLRVEGVEIVLTADRRAFASRAAFQRAGIDPFERKIVVVKLGYLFPELRDNARRAIMALSPGFTDLQVERLPFRRVPRPIFPLDRDFEWAPPPMR